MKKKIWIFMFLLVFGLGAIFTNSPNIFNASAQGGDNFIIRAYGDSISYGETLDDLTKAYPSVFAQPYVEKFQAEFLAKGVSGDTTSDLLEDLAPYQECTASDMASFEDTDIVTLCIGANNILGSALSNLGGFLTGSVTEEQYQTILDAGVEQFKTEYPQILNTFADKKVVVMTVYNPYKYMTLNDINTTGLTGMNKMLVTSLISTFETKYQKMLSMSMASLQLINDEIRNSATDDVCVVDIWNLFESFTEEQYVQYINADMSKVEIVDADINMTELQQGNYATLMNNIMSRLTTNCDPHPTEAGHAVIATEHLDTFKYFKLSTDKDFSALQDSSDKITLNVETVESGTYTYKFYKETTLGKNVLRETSSPSLEVRATQLAGQGELYVEIYENSNLIYTTDRIAYNVSLNTFTISANKTLEGVFDSGEQVTISIASSNTGDYTFKLIKQTSDATTLAETTSADITIEVDDILGEGGLYVEVYKAGTFVMKTNQIDYNVTLNSFALSSSLSLSNAIVDGIDIINFTLTAESYVGYNYKLYKETTTKTLLTEGTDSTFAINAQDLVGNGKVFAEVYKNENLMYTTNKISYSVQMNEFSFSSVDDLDGIVDRNQAINFTVSALKTQGYTFKLYKEIDGTATLIKESTTASIYTTADKLVGEGKVYVEVFKGSTKICTTNVLNFHLIIGDFRLSSSDTTNVKSEEDTISIVVNSISIPNPEYKLIKDTNGKTTVVATNKTGRFTVQAGDLNEMTGLYVEVYSNGEQVATTNTLYFQFDFGSQGGSLTGGALDNLLLYGSLALVGITVLVGVIVVFARMRKRNGF